MITLKMLRFNVTSAHFVVPRVSELDLGWAIEVVPELGSMCRCHRQIDGTAGRLFHTRVYSFRCREITSIRRKKGQKHMKRKNKVSKM